METLISLIKVLGELSLILMQLSVALAAPANYYIIPPEPNKIEVIARVPLMSEDLATSQLSPKKQVVRDEIEREALDYGVDVGLALFIAEKESRFNPTATTSLSSATGLYQFIDGTWDSLCEGERIDPLDNTRCAMRLLSEGKISHWTADKTMFFWLYEANFIDEYGNIKSDL